MAQFKDLFTELRRDTGLSQEDFAALFTNLGARFLVMKQDAINQASIC